MLENITLPLAEQLRFAVNNTAPFIFVNESFRSGPRAVKTHQMAGISFMWRRIVVAEAGALLAHEMGLGKTMQVIAMLSTIAEVASSTQYRTLDPALWSTRVLVLCPPGLIDNWVSEFEAWAPKAPSGESILGQVIPLHSGATNDRTRVGILLSWGSNGGVLVMSHDLFKIMSDPAKANDGKDPQFQNAVSVLHQYPEIVVVDEPHISGLLTAGTMFSAAFGRIKTRRIIMCTGTPLPSDSKGFLRLLLTVHNGEKDDKRLLQDWARRPDMFAKGVKNSKDPNMLERIRKAELACMHRATIDDLPQEERPSKTEWILSMSMTETQFRLYDIFYSRFIVPSLDAFEDSKDTRAIHAKTFSAIHLLGLLLCSPAVFLAEIRRKVTEAGQSANGNQLTTEGSLLRKMLPELEKLPDRPMASRKLSVLRRILDEAEKVREKVIVFSHQIKTLDFIQAKVKEGRQLFRIDGRLSAAERQAEVQRFADHRGSAIFLISTSAGGTGLNIQAANRVVIFDSRHNPSEEQQAIARSFRIGQARHVYVYWLMNKGTFETKLKERRTAKVSVASIMVDGLDESTEAGSFAEILKEKPSMYQPGVNITGVHWKDHFVTALLQDAKNLGIVDLEFDPAASRQAKFAKKAVACSKRSGASYHDSILLDVDSEIEEGETAETAIMVDDEAA
jgi:SNF2 family DNA or RNA helicase